ncbi:MAG: DNA polymerase III subunit chi [Pseudomonadota bacterium]|nr:DNA polymerase III subunit chi [Gammaproteobacteria bacterium]
MTDISFYLIPEPSLEGKLRFACRLIEKIYTQHQIYVQTSSVAIATQLNDMLWTFRDISFVPHELFDSTKKQNAPVQIGHHAQCPEQTNIVLNLTEQLPIEQASVTRIIEIVGTDETDKIQSREKFKQYKESGNDIQTFDLTQK